MDIPVFSTELTNIFPAANSKLGGQLVSEWNLRTRESVATPSSVKYMIGPSFTHSVDDFAVTSSIASSTILDIAGGRAVINGYFIESLGKVSIDMAEINRKQLDSKKPALEGNLTIGLRTFYNTNANIADSIIVENTDTLMYDGIQIVVLPTSDVRLPTHAEARSTESKVNMHLVLATFSFVNGLISNIEQNEDKIRSIEAERIANIDDIVSDTFVSKKNLDPAKLYVYNTKLVGSQQLDNWCAADDSLIIWDNDTVTSRIDGMSVEMYNTYLDQLGGVPEAQFTTTNTGYTVLVAPHKQVDGADASPDRLIFLPKASYIKNTPGTVSPEYTSYIKNIDSKITALLNLGGDGSKCRAFVEAMDNGTYSKSVLQSQNEFPSDADIAKFNVGDYIVVGADSTVEGVSGVSDRTYTTQDGTTYDLSQFITDNTLPPSTMYIVIPGIIKAYGTPVRVPATGQYNVGEEPPKPDSFADCVLVQNEIVSDNNITINQQYINDHFVYNTDDGYDIRGAVGNGYIKIVQTVYDEGTSNILGYADWYAKVTKSGNNELSNTPVYLTGRLSLATESAVGGFLDVGDVGDSDSNYRNQGYVKLDTEGRLRVVDYDYLASGVLAYQISRDQSSGTNKDAETIQTWLNEYINERVAFPNESPVGDNPSDVINIDIYLTAEDDTEETEINIHSIDSRFGASVYLHFHLSKSDGNKLTKGNIINITGCERLRIDSNFRDVGDPTINIKNCNLYYDSDILNRLNKIEGLGLWYKKYEDTDPDIQIDGMTVIQTVPPVVPETFSFWDEVALNDNHYQYGLRSITFGSDGNIIGCAIVICDRVTANIVLDTPTIYAGDIGLPQSMGFIYPKRRFTKAIKITGSFVTAYPQTKGYVVKETEFSFLIKPYGSTNEPADGVGGMISLLTKAIKVNSIVGVEQGTDICSWRSDKYHVFSGGLI